MICFSFQEENHTAEFNWEEIKEVIKNEKNKKDDSKAISSSAKSKLKVPHGGNLEKAMLTYFKISEKSPLHKVTRHKM